MKMQKYQGIFNIMILVLLLLKTSSTVAQPSNSSVGKNELESSEENFTSSSQEQKPKKKIINRRTPQRVRFKPPLNDKQPESSLSGGSRGDRCFQDVSMQNVSIQTPDQYVSTSSSFIPITPSSNFGQTIAEYPLLWVYLPKTSANKVVLSIKGEDQTHHSQTIIHLDGRFGLVSLQPNLDSSPLEIGKNYLWSVVLVCGDTPSPNDPGVASWVRRIAVSDQINENNALEEAYWYAEQGLWYDALSSLAQSRRSQPNNQDLIDIWAEFLESGGVEGIPTAPFQ